MDGCKYGKERPVRRRDEKGSEDQKVLPFSLLLFLFHSSTFLSSSSCWLDLPSVFPFDASSCFSLLLLIVLNPGWDDASENY